MDSMLRLLHDRVGSSSSSKAACIFVLLTEVAVASPDPARLGQLQALKGPVHEDGVHTAWGLASSPEINDQALVPAGNVTEGRRTNVLCNIMVNWVLSPQTWSDYQTCVTSKHNTRDMNVVGADIAVELECWCAHDVGTYIEEIGCCSSREFAWKCGVSCNPDCSSQAAKNCMDTCPAICLEEDYAPESCSTCLRDCAEYLLCITEKGANDTKAGLVDTVCDDEFFNSPEVEEYYNCVNDNPMRTNWHRQNTRSHCVCDAAVKEAAERHGCCKAKWAESICTHPCLSEDSCSTQEATKCLEDCRDTCHMVHPHEVTGDCRDLCFNVTTVGEPQRDCHEYKSCKPMDPPSFEYICDDGHPPMDNGCCKMPVVSRDGQRWEVEECPLLCDVRRKYMMRHGMECQCFECPTNNSALNHKFQEQIKDEIWENGQQTLTDIARRHSLRPGPSHKMQDLMAERNEKLNKMIEEWDGALDGLEAELQREVSKWNELIEEEAVRYKACKAQSGDDSDKCGPPGSKEGAEQGKDYKERGPRKDGKQETATPAPSGGGNEEKSDSMGLIIIVVCAVVGLALLLGVLLVAYKMMALKSKQTAQAQNPGTLGGFSTEPMDADSNVVVGRPVDGNNASAASGAPVQPSTKKGADGNPATADNWQGSEP